MSEQNAQWNSQEYKVLQLKWSRGRKPVYESGARGAVRYVADHLSSLGLPVGNVLVVGPQHGFELSEWHNRGADRILGVDVVPEFVADCQKMGFQCLECAAEELDAAIEPDVRWNVYCRETAEHFADRDRALRRIRSVLDRWAFFSIPLEPYGSRDRAHCSRFSSPSELLEYFTEGFDTPLMKVHDPRPPAGDRWYGWKGTLHALFVRKDDG